jgi:hypothetical protein
MLRPRSGDLNAALPGIRPSHRQPGPSPFYDRAEHAAVEHQGCVESLAAADR